MRFIGVSVIGRSVVLLVSAAVALMLLILISMCRCRLSWVYVLMPVVSACLFLVLLLTQLNRKWGSCWWVSLWQLL